jgi:hypothetical protein
MAFAKRKTEGGVPDDQCVWTLRGQCRRRQYQSPSGEVLASAILLRMPFAHLLACRYSFAAKTEPALRVSCGRMARDRFHERTAQDMCLLHYANL